MNQSEQNALISQLRQQAVNDQNTLYQRAAQGRYKGYPVTDTSNHGFTQFLLFLFSLGVLFFAIDYLDTEHDYVAAISHAVASNEKVQETYDKIENSDFINWIVEWVTPYIH